MRAYTPHSQRATTETLRLDSGFDIMKVKEPARPSPTRIYDKGQRAAREEASHKMPL